MLLVFNSFRVEVIATKLIRYGMKNDGTGTH